MRIRVIPGMLIAALVLVACDREKAPPGEQAAQALAEARDDIEKARTAIQQTEARSNELQEKIQSQRAELHELVERRLELLRQSLAQDEDRIRRLPAPKETELRPRFAELQKQLEDVRGKLHAYRDAPPQKSQEALAALEESLAALAERRREIESQLKPA